MDDFFSFRRMVTPFVLQVGFIVASAGALAGGVLLILLGADNHNTAEVLGGVAVILFGPFLARIFAEVLIVAFRINGTLTELRDLAIWAAERAYAQDEAEDG